MITQFTLGGSGNTYTINAKSLSRMVGLEEHGDSGFGPDITAILSVIAKGDNAIVRVSYDDSEAGGEENATATIAVRPATATSPVTAFYTGE